jgi:hypothetical protein
MRAQSRDLTAAIRAPLGLQWRPGLVREVLAARGGRVFPKVGSSDALRERVTPALALRGPIGRAEKLTRFAGFACLMPSAAADLPSGESEHASGGVLAAPLLTIGPKRKFAVPSAGFSNAAGRRWTWNRTLLRGYPRIAGTTQRMRTRLHSGRVEVVVLSLPYS